MSARTTGQSFYWFDYETFGRSPVWARPAQFAGLRTDMDLQPIGKPDVFYCRLAEDSLPEPGACRITGITPELALREGLCESDFMDRVVALLGAPGTVSIGYNNIRFDDEFTRHSLFRNLREPYAHEWRDGNSRWDLLFVMRMARALRPEGLAWPTDPDGWPVNSLEALAAANGIGHTRAHDALSDVEATLGLARLLRARQPKLFDYLFAQRGKAAAASLLNVRERTPILIASSRVPRERHNLGAILPLCRHPERGNSVIVLDLATDPDALPQLDVDTLRQRIFDRDQPLDERIGLFTVKLNACPVLAPLQTLRPADAERLGMDVQRIRERATRLRTLLDSEDGTALQQRIVAALTREWPANVDDVDGSLYGGGFLGDGDRRRLDAVREQRDRPPIAMSFDDDRLAEQVFRWRARNWPDSLAGEEELRWLDFVSDRLSSPDAPWLTWSGFDQAMSECDWRDDEAGLKTSLERHASRLKSELRSRVARHRS